MSPLPGDKVSSLLAILSYCGSSILMTLVNKLVLKEFKEPPIVFLMLSVQALACILLVYLFGSLKLLNFRSFNLVDAKKWFPVSVVMSLMLYTGSKSLEYLPVGIFTVFKNLTIMLVAYGEKVIFKSQVTPLMLFSFILMVISSIVGGWYTDIPDTQVGYLWMVANCFSSAFFVLYMRKAIKTVSFKDFDTVYFNNLLTFPIFITMSFFLEDWSKLRSFYSTERPELLNSLLRALFISGFSAFAISYTSAWCIRVTNSTTYSMVGALNKLPVALFGMVYFSEAITFSSLGAVFLGFFAGVVYSRAKTLQQLTIAASTNPAANSYHQIVCDQENETSGNTMGIALAEIEKKNQL